MTPPNPATITAPAWGESILTAIDVRKRYGRTVALDGVSLEIKAGEVICVIGPNGAGKTTLLYCLGGLLEPNSGHIRVFGRDRLKENFDIRLLTTFTPDHIWHSLPSTPYEYWRFYAQVYAMPLDRFRHKIERLVDDMQYRDHVHKTWDKLSLGLTRKATLIAAFLPDVPLRIMDEPFAGGIDPIGMDTLYRWFEHARKRGETIIFSTQVLDQAEHAANRLIVLHKGYIRASGAPADIIREAGVSASHTRPLYQAFITLTQNEANPSQ